MLFLIRWDLPRKTVINSTVTEKNVTICYESFHNSCELNHNGLFQELYTFSIGFKLKLKGV